MRIESSVTSLSWIPSEAVTGANKGVFEIGFTHYDDPPPDVIEDLDTLRESDAFRFANRLEAWVDVEGGKIVDAGYGGGGAMGSTTVRLGGKGVTFAAVELPELRDDPVVTPRARDVRADLRRPHRAALRRAACRARRSCSSARRSCGRRSRSPSTPTARAASSSSARACSRGTGCTTTKASSRPRSGSPTSSSGTASRSGGNTPWGSTNSTAFVTAVETALERELAGLIMRGGDKPEIRKLKAGALLTEQGEPGDEVFLVLDGVLAIEVDGEPLAEFGPGAILGERAVLEGGVRTSTLRAVTKCRVAVAQGDQLDRTVLEEISQGHRREQTAA